jgi:hypothetical protein
MATTPVFEVTFQIRKAGIGQGQADIYRREQKTCLLAAATSHPKDILSVLASNFTLGSGESFDVLSVQPIHIGGSGANVLS